MTRVQNVIAINDYFDVVKGTGSEGPEAELRNILTGAEGRINLPPRYLGKGRNFGCNFMFWRVGDGLEIRLAPIFIEGKLTFWCNVVF